jgi:anti-sigma B factor antagonist/stage II sporulation protein AA (anti-sigma F factor antagonist)
MSPEPSRHLEPIPLRLTTYATAGGGVRLAVAGEIDIATVDPLADAMLGIIRDRQPVRLDVDFAEVTFLDSSGVAALVAAWQSASADRIDFTVVNCGPNVLRVLEITGMVQSLTGSAPASAPAGAPDQA